MSAIASETTAAETVSEYVLRAIGVTKRFGGLTESGLQGPDLHQLPGHAAGGFSLGLRRIDRGRHLAPVRSGVVGDMNLDAEMP